MSIFETLNKINVNEKTEKKNGLTYLSWAWAWGEVKKAFPDALFTIYERETQYGPVNYFTDGRTCWVKTGLTINGLEHIEELPVMDYRNNSIPLEKVNSTDVNKAIQRSLTKAAARHGLGLYIYAGEDLPECEQDKKDQEPPEPAGKPFIPPAEQGKADVSTSDKLPDQTPEIIFLTKAMKELREDREISAEENKKLFRAQKDELVKAGLAPKKDIKYYTLDELKNLIEAMRANFTPTGTELKVV